MSQKIYFNFSIIKKIFFLLILSILFTNTNAQLGQFLHIWGGPQEGWINNREDFFIDNEAKDNTIQKDLWRMGLGVEFIQNFDYLHQSMHWYLQLSIRIICKNCLKIYVREMITSSFIQTD
mgnify:CR=1 FL=1